MNDRYKGIRLDLREGLVSMRVCKGDSWVRYEIWYKVVRVCECVCIREGKRGSVKAVFKGGVSSR